MGNESLTNHDATTQPVGSGGVVCRLVHQNSEETE